MLVSIDFCCIIYNVWTSKILRCEDPRKAAASLENMVFADWTEGKNNVVKNTTSIFASFYSCMWCKML